MAEYVIPAREDSPPVVVDIREAQKDKPKEPEPPVEPKPPPEATKETSKAKPLSVLPVYVPAAQEFPPINNEMKAKKIVEDDFVPPTSGFKGLRYRMEQQQKSTCALPMYFFNWPMQACCGTCCTVLLLLIGAMAFMAAGDIKEIVIPYTYEAENADGYNGYKDFVVDEDMEGDINMWYDIPDVIINQKRYIENTDGDVIKLMPMGGKKACKDAETQADANWRRRDKELAIRALTNSASSNDRWSELVASIPAPTFKPCGLQSIAMFTDEYLLQMQDGTTWVNQTLDESDIYLEKDDDFFDKRIAQDGGILKIEGETSWIPAGNFYNHFKVWMRSPASPHVRHLWAVKKGGLRKGTYRLLFLKQSAIWTWPQPLGWGVDEKRVVFSTQNTLGSKGACQILAWACFIGAAAEAITTLI
eukprot:CAMPEP_0169404216 /NCGR_PEP_ID=MMETSP1017-20121227/56227_1 /TAXON_ID=342587 /ORGANISM="Karlodinium micrum, Strain CCMP2283" /LENGTH=416 /DNA_ID=CAMNT_0009510595 /DNA_START=211 /DNA_END=1458 /DNA_ORIENTATION=-